MISVNHGVLLWVFLQTLTILLLCIGAFSPPNIVILLGWFELHGVETKGLVTILNYWCNKLLITTSISVLHMKCLSKSGKANKKLLSSASLLPSRKQFADPESSASSYFFNTSKFVKWSKNVGLSRPQEVSVEIDHTKENLEFLLIGRYLHPIYCFHLLVLGWFHHLNGEKTFCHHVNHIEPDPLTGI